MHWRWVSRLSPTPLHARVSTFGMGMMWSLLASLLNSCELSWHCLETHRDGRRFHRMHDLLQSHPIRMHLSVASSLANSSGLWNVRREWMSVESSRQDETSTGFRNHCSDTASAGALGLV